MYTQSEKEQYFITYCVMDTAAGANLFGHAFLLLSKQLDDGSIEVVNTLGYYSQPTSTTQPIVKTLKNVLGVVYDLQDVHGELRHEKMREINHNGLTGLSFPLNEQQFAEHNQKFTDLVDIQKKTIEELNTQLSILEKNGYDQSLLEKIANDTHLIEVHQPKILELLKQGTEDLNHQQAHNGYKRFLLEKILNRNPKDQRLQRFHLQLDFGLFGPDTRASYTCKDRALDYLYDNCIIDESLKAQFRNTYRALAPFPCTTGLVSLHPIRLQATGDLHLYTSKNGQKKYFNPHFAYELAEDKKASANRLFWVSPPVVKDDDQKIHPTVIEVLNNLKAVQADLYRHYSESDGSDFELLKHRLEDKIKFFTNASKYHKLDELNQSISSTTQFLNALSLKLHPEILDQSFLLRVYYDLHLRNALKALVVLSLSTLYLSSATTLGFIGVASYLLAAASLYYGMTQTYAFFKKESQLPQMKQDYQTEFASLKAV